LDGIRERLAEHGFDPETAYRDWLLALQRIAELSAGVGEECVWQAPLHPKDPQKSEADVQRFVDSLTKRKPGNTAS